MMALVTGRVFELAFTLMRVRLLSRMPLLKNLRQISHVTFPVLLSNISWYQQATRHITQRIFDGQTEIHVS